MLARPADADTGACKSVASDWLAGCPDARHLRMTRAECPPGGVVLWLDVEGGHTLRVQVSEANEGSFRRAGSLGLSPVGEYPDWSKEPESVRAALDALVACAEKSPSLELPSGTLTPKSELADEPVDRGAPLPWLLIAAVGIASFVCAARWRRRPPSRRALATAGLLVALASVVAVARSLLVPTGFFHMNGQGPLWIEHALKDRMGLSGYGGGFTQVFGWVAHAWSKSPERAIFVANGALGAACVPWAWLIARGVGARPTVAWAAAVVVGADPILARLSQSESYYGVGASLLFAASAVLANGAWRASVRAPTFWLSVAASGLLIAQAARVHPTSWIAAAMIPLILAVARGPWRRRLTLTVAAGLGIAVVVAAASGRVLLDVIGGSVGGKWMGEAGLDLSFGATSWWGVLALPALAALLLRRFRGLVPVVIGGLVVLALDATSLLKAQNEWTQLAYLHLGAPVVVAALASWASTLFGSRRQSWVAAAALVLLSIALAIGELGVRTFLPTDYREGHWALEWRKRLPERAVVVHLARADRWIVALPLYGGAEAPRVRLMKMEADAPAPDLRRLAGEVYYYRSSICSSKEGRAACDAIEKRYRFEPVEARQLPAASSMPYLSYDDDEVAVGLYRLAE